jgi:uncharacterized protein (TIGR02646 family)
MKHIVKNQPPKSFIEFCNKPYAVYDGSGFPKEELRQSLLSEQGHICCYCMKRIPEHSPPYMKVEHYKCRDNYSTLQLTYTNLFGACIGNEGQPKVKQTCDTKKGNAELKISLTLIHPNCESLFKYNADGEISSITGDEDINRQLNEVLNLNMQTIKDGRSEVFLKVQERVRRESKKAKKDPAAFIKFLEKEKLSWLQRTDNKLRPFCMVAIYYLTKKIKSNQS